MLAFAFSSSAPLTFARFTSDSSYSAFRSSFPFSRSSASQLLPRSPPPLSLPRFPRSFPPDLSCVLSRFPYSALLPVSFRPYLLRSRSRSTGVHPYLRLAASFRMFVLAFRFVTSASGLELNYSASVSSFQLFRAPPHSGFSRAQFRSRFPDLLRSLRLIAQASSPDSLTRLPVRFLSPFLASLPQLFHECLPHPLGFGLFRFRSAHFRSLLFRLRLLSFPVLPFRSSRCRLTAAFPVPPAPLSLPWLSADHPPGFPCFPSASRTWLLCRFPFVLPSSAPAAASLVLAFLRFLASPSFRPFPFPSAFFRPPRFPSDYSAFRLFFSLLPGSPDGGSSGTIFPLPSGLFPCPTSDSGTQRSVLPFTRARSASQMASSLAAPCLSV